MNLKITTLCICFISLVWIIYNFNLEENKPNASSSCIFKIITNYPCPACGTTRASIQAFHGKIISSLKLNPLGLFVSILLIFLPILIATDVIFKTNKFDKLVEFSFKEFQKKQTLIILLLLLIMNWIWNYFKHL